VGFFKPLLLLCSPFAALGAASVALAQDGGALAGSGLVVAFPAAPQRDDSSTLNLPLTPPLPIHLAFASPEHQDVFMASWVDLPPVNPQDRTLSCSDATALVDALRDDLVANFHGSLLGDRRIIVSGRPARELDLTGLSATNLRIRITGRFFFVGHRYFRVLVFREGQNAKRAAAFLASPVVSLPGESPDLACGSAQPVTPNPPPPPTATAPVPVVTISPSNDSAKPVHVRSYVRRDGTIVHDYYRRSPRSH
jgi:hypothetical protein